MDAQRVPIDLPAYQRRILSGPCFVCAIISGDPAYDRAQVVFEDDAHIAFLDGYPTLYGKVLVAPKTYIEHVVADLPLQAFLELLPSCTKSPAPSRWCPPNGPTCSRWAASRPTRTCTGTSHRCHRHPV